MASIGIDIGGTNIKMVVVDDHGQINEEQSAPTPSSEKVAGKFFNKILVIAQDYYQNISKLNYKISSVGFSVPHFVTGPDWVQVHTNNLPQLEGYPIKKPITEAFGNSVEIIIDMDAFTIAEHELGNGRNSKRLFVMAIGTGVGASVFIENYGFVDYSWGTAGDTGQIIVDPTGAKTCTCGAKGCLEAYVSANAIINAAVDEINKGKLTLLRGKFYPAKKLTLFDVVDAALDGDMIAKSIFDKTGWYIGVALTSYIHIFQPDKILLGGGVANTGNLILDPIIETVNKMACPSYLNKLTSIEQAKFTNYGGAIGAAIFASNPNKYRK